MKQCLTISVSLRATEETRDAIETCRAQHSARDHIQYSFGAVATFLMQTALHQQGIIKDAPQLKPRRGAKAKLWQLEQDNAQLREEILLLRSEHPGHDNQVLVSQKEKTD